MNDARGARSHWIAAGLLLAACQGSPSVDTLELTTAPFTSGGTSTTVAEGSTGVPTGAAAGSSSTTETAVTDGGPTGTTSTGTETGSASTGSADTSSGGESGDSSSGGGEPVCGNGEVEDGEACDDGDRDDEDPCLGNCSLASCGDGHVEAGVEACDDGNQVDDDECTNACASANCGDGIVQAGEACDLGADNSNTGMCTLACFAPVCGDGFVQPSSGEACDDKDGDDSDACPGTCQVAVCGDGFVHLGAETCDDGDADSTDACTTACEPAACGDGHVHAGVEACDGGGMATPTCDLDCTPAMCGDGALNAAAGEVCDDGNVTPNDGCEPSCKFAVRVAVGVRHACVRTGDGHGRCWGANPFGAVGNNSQYGIGCKQGDLPMPNLGFGGQKVDQIGITTSHACALLMNGELRCWGNFPYLGYGVLDDNTWVPPPNGLNVGAPVKQLAVGSQFTCVLTDSGGVRCWGDGKNGRLGNGSTDTVGNQPGELPVPDIQLGGPAVQVGVGKYHACAVLEGGAVKCWGENEYGQLGVGHVNDIGDQPGEMPPAAAELGGPAVQVAVGEYHTCALLADGKVRCWGVGSAALGQGHKLTIGDGPGEMPPAASDIGGKAIEVVAGWIHSCALLDTGKVRCWGGYGLYRGIGVGGSGFGDEPGEMPPPDAILGGTAVALAQSGGASEQVCALMDDAKLRCWGLASDCGLGLPIQQTGMWFGDNEVPTSLGPVPY